MKYTPPAAGRNSSLALSTGGTLSDAGRIGEDPTNPRRAFPCEQTRAQALRRQHSLFSAQFCPSTVCLTAISRACGRGKKAITKPKPQSQRGFHGRSLGSAGLSLNPESASRWHVAKTAFIEINIDDMGRTKPADFATLNQLRRARAPAVWYT